MSRFPSDPVFDMVAVTKANTDLAGGVTRGLLCGTAGTVNLKMASNSIVTSVPLQQGYNPLEVIQVRVNGTADDIWALY